MMNIRATLFLLLLSTAPTWGQMSWTKHVIVESKFCTTAVSLDANGDQALDVISSYDGKVELLLAPAWQNRIVLHSFERGGQRAIHSAVLDVDGDGDLDWAGGMAGGPPFWLENPGKDQLDQAAWTARVIDPDITGIHCVLASDIDNDGREDLVINNFKPDAGVANSIIWLSVPENPHTASRWNRHVFADGDAPGGSHYMSAADIDGDGWKEISNAAKGAPFENGNWFAFWTNPGLDGVKGAWQKTLLAENQLAATNIEPGDINGDGKVDWVGSRGHSAGVIWFENPTWKIHQIDPDIESPHALTVADYDQDGDMDVAACGFESQWVRWYENDGAGTFKIHTLDESQQSYDLRSVDMDGDGDLDLLNAGRGSKNVVWYENQLK